MHHGRRRAAAGENRVRILIAERNPLVMTALSELAERDGRFELIGSVHSGKAFLAAAAAPAFDVAVLAWNLSDMDGSDVLAELCRRQLTPRITIFSSDHDIAVLKQAVRSGVRGFCYQFDDPSILFETLFAVAHGRICIPYIDIMKINDTPISRLTNRERELLAALADGWTNMQIGTRTGISENTVKYHLKNLYEKLEVRNRAMAVALYFRENAHRAS
ncbi:LuxR family transcriptional regulator [Mesorhizobium sp. WSM1497]|uniref:LuxR C-terminal-related transcriptional regulator n=1 Tax=Mesorhizobium sp. WSM1497 TaxID=278153 RepID=UPI0007ED69AE|nr:response regulator transcription factor [Mesorhizobium sp. WSM1497]ARP63402.1 LuxR family transcriptional regulator [Mesorhizobium sp. WSM1497]